MEAIKPELFEAVRFLLYLAGALVAFFFMRTLIQIDRNQKELFTRLECLSQEFHHMKGEHEAMKFRCYGQQHLDRVIGRE